MGERLAGTAPAATSSMLEVATEPADPARRAWLGGALAVGGVAAVNLVAAGAARAQGGSLPAYQDASNTFTANQLVMADLGIGVQPLVPLHVVRSSAGTAFEIDADTMALLAEHSRDWGASTYDLIDLFHKSVGDAVFVAHQGGIPPTANGPFGAIAGLNLLIPYYLDDTTTGRNGSVPNTKTGQRGLKLQTQATVDRAVTLDVAHWGNAYAANLQIQPQANNEPQGRGGGILMNDYGAASSLKVGKWQPPGDGDAMVTLTGKTSAAIQAVRIRQGSGGATLWTDGTAAFGTNNPFAVRLHIDQSSSGIARNLALSNGAGTQGSGAQVEFDDAQTQYATIKATFDRNSPPRNASLHFSVRSNGHLTEQLQLSAAGLGFYGSRPSPQAAVVGSRGGNTALASLIGALASLGLASNSSTA